jgi:hypothetical protein
MKNEASGVLDKIKYFWLQLLRWLHLRFVAITLLATKRTARKLNNLAIGIAAIGDTLVIQERLEETQEEGREHRLAKREQRRPR